MHVRVQPSASRHTAVAATPRLVCRPAARRRPAGARQPVHVHAEPAEQRSATTQAKPDAVSFQHLLLTILDANSYLSDGSKQALQTAALLAQSHAGRVTVLVIDEPGTTAQEPQKQIESISWHLREHGVEEFKVLQRATTQPASVLIGDVADEVSADMVLLASDAIHARHVDANQLSEFVACPLLVLP